MMMCKRCGSSEQVKNGVVRGKQRYRCSSCGCNFVEGDGRSIRHFRPEAKALGVLLYGMMKNSSYGMIARLFNTSRKTVQGWIVAVGQRLPDVSIPESATDIELDEMWHFIQSKKRNFGSGKHWIVARGVPSPGLSVIVMLKPVNASTTSSGR